MTTRSYKANPGYMQSHKEPVIYPGDLFYTQDAPDHATGSTFYALICDFQKQLLLGSLFNSNSASNGCTNHRVVAHADETHHLNVCRNRGGTCRLKPCIGVHTAHGIGHAVRGRTGSHVIRMQRTACAAAGSNGEVLHAVLIAPLLVGTCNRVLESGRVRGVTGDGNADVLRAS